MKRLSNSEIEIKAIDFLAAFTNQHGVSPQAGLVRDCLEEVARRQMIVTIEGYFADHHPITVLKFLQIFDHIAGKNKKAKQVTKLLDLQQIQEALDAFNKMNEKESKKKTIKAVENESN